MNAVISGSANVGKDIKVAFQVQPSPFTTDAGCDPKLPATPHPGAMMIVLADASVRSVTPNILPLIWWQACSPDDGGKMPEDW